MTRELDKTFDPAAIEAKWYSHWEDNGLFRPERPDAEPFTIVNPPPNVTGSLHIGHALDNTLQDIVIRYERMRGKDALWVVGTDHAGIATQMVVERQMEARQDKRTNYSREDFVDKVWEWKAESGGTITRQLRRLGCSMDWSREQFTMDPHFTRAVVKVFVDLYNQGLIYRDKRLVNWDPKLKTAISDLEVETQNIQGGFWHFKYPLADGVTLDDGREYIEVATTRPETMLADMAVAVHPSDERYASVVGKFVTLPITGRRIPIVADEHADPELGSGAVKITPGHDFNDFEVGKRAGITPADMLNMLDADAAVCQCADGLIPEALVGMDRFDARARVVELLKEQDLLIPHISKNKQGEEEEHDAEPRVIATPFGDRGGVVIEPWLTDQWYVNAAELAKAPIAAVKNGDIEIVPKTWEKTFFNWMENIQPWCVSRQLWWGHRIPAWYDANGNVFVAETEAEAQTLAGGKALTRDEDVLDTWFSSALWPFATLGWPEEDSSPSTSSGRAVSLYERHYPNDLLISGFDILFFWDARMMMMGQAMTGQNPWPRLYLHGLVRAPDGQKMSKSKGNVVDPLGLIDQYGADALRFFMAAMESQGRDIKMDEKRVEGYRNFATKLWNATRFCQSNGIGASGTIAAPEAKLAANQWIIGEVQQTVEELDKAMADLRFDAAANTIYHFTWSRFCDWYLELIKPVFQGDADSDAAKETRPSTSSGQAALVEETKAVAGWALDQILVMLHPFMPFITEELWHAQGDRPYELIVAKWPEPQASVSKDATDAKAEIEWLIGAISEIRSTRVALDAGGKPMSIFVSRAAEPQLSWFIKNLSSIARMTRAQECYCRTPEGNQALEALSGDPTSWADIIVAVEGEGEVQLVIEGIDGQLDFFGEVDLESARTRLTKSLEASTKEARSLEGRLNNPAFVEKAKPEAVEKAREDHAHHSAEIARLQAALERLG